MDITTSLVPVLQNMKTGNDGTECLESAQRTLYSALPTHCTDSLAHRQSEWPFSWHTTNQRIQWLRRPTAHLLRLCLLNQSRQRPRGPESIQHSWTHQTYLFPTSSESPQMLQTSSGWAGVFLPSVLNRGHWLGSLDSLWIVFPGVNPMLRKVAVAAASKPHVEIKQNGEQFYIKTSTTVRTTEINFHIGEEFNEETVDGRKCKVNELNCYNSTWSTAEK